jgi:terminase small subunit-like protein
MPFDPEKAERICNAIAERGLTLRQVAAEEGISDSLIIWNANHDETFAKQYARAIEIRTDRDFEKLEDDLNEQPAMVPTKFGEMVDSGWVAWKRVQIDTRKWALSKRNPKKFGDKLEHVGDPDAPIVVKVDM